MKRGLLLHIFDLTALNAKKKNIVEKKSHLKV